MGKGLTCTIFIVITLLVKSYRSVVFVLGAYSILYVYLLLQDDRTALIHASTEGHLFCVSLLMQWGRHVVNYKDKVSSTKAVRCLLLICVLVVCVTRESDK